MKKLLTFVLSLLLVAGCFTLAAVATEESTFSNTLLVFNDDAKNMKVIGTPNGINKAFYNSEWEGARLKITEVDDPYLIINWATYIKKAGLENIDSQSYPFVVFKLKVEGYIDDMEMFYCAGDVIGPAADYGTTTDYPCECSGEIEYIIYDLTDDCEGNYNMFRMDPMGAEEDTMIYLYELALFATEEEALAYTGLLYETEEETVPETVAPETETIIWESEEVTSSGQTTEYPTTDYDTLAPEVDAPTTVAPEITDPESLLGDLMDIPLNGFQGLLPTLLGCNASVSVGVVTLLSMIALGAICFKKKD